MSDKATIGDVIAAFLEECGVGAAFGVISIHNMPFLDAIGRRGKIRYVAARGEAGAVKRRYVLYDELPWVGSRLVDVAHYPPAFGEDPFGPAAETTEQVNC